MVFESEFYGSIDVARAVREQWGPKATVASTGQHLYDWKAQVGVELKSLDLHRAVRQQYGEDWTLVAVGVHLYDWKAFRFDEASNTVLAAVLIASDRFLDIAGVRQALDRYRSVLENVRNWYYSRADATFRLLQPLVIPTNPSSAEWNNLSQQTQQPPYRYVLLDAAIEAYGQRLPQPGPNLKIVLAPYTGASASFWLGAASRGEYVVVPPRATSLNCPASGPLSAQCADAAYAVGHELGHTFGLDHSCSAYPLNANCANSIMETGRPPGAILLPGEICTARSSGFFIAATSQPSEPYEVCVITPDGLVLGA